MRLPTVLMLACAALLAGCAAPRHAAQASADAAGAAHGWHAVKLPGKPATRYWAEFKDGLPAVAAQSDRSASLWRHRMERPMQSLGELSFSWWVDQMIAGASVADVDREDAPARLLLAFGGDVASLPLRTRMMFELAEALSGETPPYATLMYVWDANLPVGSVIVNPRSDRVRKIVVDSGPEHLRRWRKHRRDLVADFRLAFGEDPGPLRSIALMTDSDNTASSARVGSLMA